VPQLTGPTRRQFLQRAAAGAVAAASLVPSFAYAEQKKAGRLRIGSCMLELPQAKQAGLDGIEIRTSIVGDELNLADPAVREQYKKQMKETGLPVSSLMLGFFNSFPLASDPRGPKWLQQAIEAGQDLGAPALLVAFFSNGDLLDDQGRLKKADVDAVVRHLKAVATKAQQSGTVLAIENWLSARQNAEILDRVGSAAVRIYYDVGNSSAKGYDVPAEIRWLRDRIAVFHFKDDRHYLGEGKIPFAPIAAAIEDIGYQGWIVMETASPSGNPVGDAQRNAVYVRKLFGVS
jgi:sugar phosphate isomerase/epimerase